MVKQEPLLPVPGELPVPGTPDQPLPPGGSCRLSGKNGTVRSRDFLGMPSTSSRQPLDFQQDPSAPSLCLSFLICEVGVKGKKKDTIR